MISKGLPEEAERVYNMCRQQLAALDVARELSGLTALQAIGYKELIPLFGAGMSRNGAAFNAALSEAAEQIKQNSRRYAKRQLTLV